jgi:hypothetical protein
MQKYCKRTECIRYDIYKSDQCKCTDIRTMNTCMSGGYFMCDHGSADDVDMTVSRLKCCGNCRHMDILVDEGGVCIYDEKTPCMRNGYCDNWEFNK